MTKIYSLNSRLKCIFLFFAISLIAQISLAQEITFRFTNPETDCNNYILCYDAEAQMDQTGVLLDELNIRFYIDDEVFVLHELTDPDPNYFLETGGESFTGTSGSGQSFFGFEGEFIYIIDNLKRVGVNGTEIEVAPNWTYLFKACFSEADPLDFCPHYLGLCPPIVWDHDIDGSGFGDGSDGIEALAVNPNGGPGLAIDEAVINTNWDYYLPDPSLGECAPLCVEPIPELLFLNINDSDCQNIQITWTAEEEIGNAGTYYIQRRYAGMTDWNKVGELESYANGIKNKFEFHDRSNKRISDKIYYRLLFIDLFGEVEIVGEKEIELSCSQFSQLSIFPNPAREQITAEYTGSIETLLIRNIYDSDGNLIQRKKLEAFEVEDFYSETIDISYLIPGSYFIEFISGTKNACASFEKIE